ncbi:MAG: hypothetical protein AB8E15_03375 [Bdellovibrionales bacterium]
MIPLVIAGIVATLAVISPSSDYEVKTQDREKIVQYKSAGNHLAQNQ